MPAYVFLEYGLEVFLQIIYNNNFQGEWEVTVCYIYLIYLNQSWKILVFSIESSTVIVNVTQETPFNLLSGYDNIVCCDFVYTRLL